MNEPVIDLNEESVLAIVCDMVNESVIVLSEVNRLLVIALVVIDCDNDLNRIPSLEVN